MLSTLYTMYVFIHGFSFIPWQVSCAMTQPHCSQPPRAPCYLGAGWSSWPGCWEETTPWDWCPSPPAETQTQTQTGRLESVLSSGFWHFRYSCVWHFHLASRVRHCNINIVLYSVSNTTSVNVLHRFCKFQPNRKTNTNCLHDTFSDFVFSFLV